MNDGSLTFSMNKKIIEKIEQALLTYENRVINNPIKKYRTAEIHAIAKYTAELIQEELEVK